MCAGKNNRLERSPALHRFPLSEDGSSQIKSYLHYCRCAAAVASFLHSFALLSRSPNDGDCFLADDDAGCPPSVDSDSWSNLNLRTQGWQCRWWSPMMNNNGLVVELVVLFAVAAAAPGRLHRVRD